MTDVAIDSCCLLNLIAADNIILNHEDSALSGLTYSLHIPEQVEAESLYVYQPEKGNEKEVEKCQIDIQSLVDVNLLSRCKLLEGEESDLFVQLAVQLDDGEAACLAIAKIRSWSIATDDRVARRISNDLGVPTVGTAQLVRSWAESKKVSNDYIRRSISNIERFARFVPRSGTPDAEWWFSHTD